MGINGEGIGFHKKTLVFVPGLWKVREDCQALRFSVILSRPSSWPSSAEFQKFVRFMIRWGCQIMTPLWQVVGLADLLRQAFEKFAPAGYENYEIRPTIACRSRSIIGLNCSFRPVLRMRSGLLCPEFHYLVSRKKTVWFDKVTQQIINKAARLQGKQ